MSIFSRCCPKKPKMTLDYVIKWIEETDKTLKEVVAWKEQIEEDDLKTLFDTYAESYPWDQVPIIGDLQEDVSDLQHDLRSLETNVSGLETDVDSRLAARIEKPNECVAGNVPVWTENLGLDGEGRAIDEDAPSADSVDLITSGAVYTALQGKADSEHSHNIITNQASGGRTALFEVDATSRTATLKLNDGTTDKSAEINMDNIDNLNRALEGPVAPSQGSDKLSTSGQIYTAISKKSDKEFCDKVYSRLMELEKNSSIEYGITATYVYREGGLNRPRLKIDGTDIIYDYDSAGNEIMVLYNVPYLYGLAFVGDVLVIKDLTFGTSIGTATIEELMTGPNRIRLSGLSLPNDASYDGKSIEIAITHGNY